MAMVMSEMPDVWRRVLAEHVPDAGQKCRECRSSAGETASWPCQTFKIGQEAKWVAEGNLPGTGPNGRPHRTPSSDRWDGGRASWDRPARSRGLSAADSGSFDQPRTDSGPWSRPDPYRQPTAPSGSPGSRHTRLDDVPPLTGGRPPADGRHYGGGVDAPYGSTFGVDDRPRARR